MSRKYVRTKCELKTKKEALMNASSTKFLQPFSYCQYECFSSLQKTKILHFNIFITLHYHEEAALIIYNAL